MKHSSYDEKYSKEEYYWGKAPSAICDRVIEIVRPRSKSRPKLLDVGCGEGRNAVYFAKHGFEVTGLDLSEKGLEKTRKLAQAEGVSIRTIRGDIAEYQLSDKYEVIFSTGTLHFVKKSRRTMIFQSFKKHTSHSGVNAISVFVRKPFIARAPDADRSYAPFISGELMGYYWDWAILHLVEEIFDCTSSGIPHRHAVDRLIARRYP